MISQGDPWLPIMFLLGGSIGIPMAIEYPCPSLTKILIILGLVISLLAVIYGFIKSRKIHGQILAIAGIITWLLIGTIYGLGTGT
jgi:hypothetical protein